MSRYPSATQVDWSRESLRWFEWAPGKRLIKAIRSHQHWKTRGAWARPLRAWCALRARCWNIVCGSDIPLGATLGGGLMLPHPNGIVIHPEVHIGVNCMVFQQVTLGTGGPKPGVPTIGGHVDIGAGAKILGGVIIGHHAKIGANAVVLADVPEEATAVGIPARIIPAEAPPLPVPAKVQDMMVKENGVPVSATLSDQATRTDR